MHLASGLLFFGLSAAIFEDEVRSVDWKLSLFGLPISAKSNGTHLAVLGDSGAFGVIDANGYTLWSRRLETSTKFDKKDKMKSLALLNDEVAVSGGDYIGVYEFDTGELKYTMDHSSTCVHQYNNTFYADNYAIRNGKLVNADTTGFSQFDFCSKLYSPLQLANNQATLSWDTHGVLKFSNPSANIAWTRDEGLASADEALFVHTQLLSTKNAEYLEILQDLTSKNASNFKIWLKRTQLHVSQLLKGSKHLISSTVNLLFKEPVSSKHEFMFDQVLVIKTELGSVYGLSTVCKGRILWSLHEFEPVSIVNDDCNVSQFYIYTANNKKLQCTWSGVCKQVENEETVQNFGIKSLSFDGAVIKSPIYGWTVKLPGSRIVSMAERSADEVTASIASPIDENNVLYKYLNPYAVAIATSDFEEMTVTVLDTVSGRVLFQALHPDPVVINTDWPLKMVFGEHWVAYTYMSTDASHAPKLTVLDLFESGVPNQRLSGSDVIALQDTLIPYVSMRTWTLPGANEPVYALQTSRTLFGASSRDLIVARRHRIEAFPKQWLSTIVDTPAARAAREKLGDSIIVPPRGYLSHHEDAPRVDLLVTGPTGLESTYLLAALGGPNVFFTMVSPSGEYDRIAKTFPKLKLLGFVIVLVLTSMMLSPMVKNRMLKLQWR